MNIVIIGSGNVAHHLGNGLQKAGYHIKQVYSRNKANAIALASTLKTEFTDNLSSIDKSADIYIVAVSDHAISSVVASLPSELAGYVIHCSGATGMDVLARFTNYGVIYPVQSLSKDVQHDSLDHIPFAIEANNDVNTEHLLAIMRPVAVQVFPCDSSQRLALHVSAVFVNNFSNALFTIAYSIMQDADLPFDLLKPIILETAEKVKNHIPKDVQTGPASRNDLETIEKHLNFISGKPNWVKIYQHLSQEISSKKDS